MSLIKDTLYAKYIKTRAGQEVLETEHGFVIYKIVEKECFIADMFIDEKHRGSGHFRQLIAQLSEIAKANNCEVLSAFIHIPDKSHKRALMAALGFGFVIATAEQNRILVIKKLGEE